MSALTALVRKDLILYLSNRRALLISLLMPIVLGAFFGYLFGGSGAVSNGKIDIALVQLDDSGTSRKIAAGLKGDSTLNVQELPLAAAQDKVRHGKLSVAVVLPAGFGAAAKNAFFGGRNKPAIAVYYDPSQQAVLAMVKGMLTQYVMQNVSAEMFDIKASDSYLNTSIDALQRNASQNPDLLKMLSSVKEYQSRTAKKEENSVDEKPAAPEQAGLSVPYSTNDQALTSGLQKYNGYAHAFAGMSVQFILFMGIDAGIAVLLWRRMGLWNRLLAAPITLNTVLLARALSSAIIAFVILCVIFLFAMLVLKVQIAGSLPGFIGVGICFALVTASFGLLIAAFGKTPEAARGLAMFATLIMVMLGGAWVPSFLFPQWLQTLTLAVPTRWAVDGLDAMTWRGLGFDTALPAMAVLLGFAVLFGGLAVWRFRRDALKE
ncbi:ABC-2 type transport system permease protein [Collimonas sp. PA-H2]|uniref:ABC transporter permease n=1 Tax=Collimonas sp. PA-H2 TaxID=1881062 RepID=UPI000BF6BAEB|nr:ABC transporter permease [Collimonas sp. PA-H2]PFH12109.1 ABC-2 type transport system permease protein [Collimonas sp. PA-H2]